MYVNQFLDTQARLSEPTAMGRPQEVPSLKQWHDAQQIKELFDLNRAFIEQKIQRAPHTCLLGPIKPSHYGVTEITKVLDLNDRGIFVLEGSSQFQSEEGRGRARLSFVMEDGIEAPKMFAYLKGRPEVRVLAQRYSDPTVEEGSENELVSVEYISAGEEGIALEVSRGPEVFQNTLFKLKPMKEANPWFFVVVAESWDAEITIVKIVAEVMDNVQSSLASSSRELEN